MGKTDMNLTSAEIGSLWSTYILNTATSCFYKHFLQGVEDLEIKPIIEEALNVSVTIVEKIKNIFETENFPVPFGFTDEDIDLSAPPLFTDLFALSFVYRGGQMIMLYYSDALSKVGRMDIVEFFSDSLTSSIALFKKALTLMLEKGIYDRPPKMEYPKKAEFITKESSVLEAWLGGNRPLNAIELSELFFSIERNGIGLVLLIGLLQASKDKEIKEYLLKGKKFSQKQIDEFNKFLRKNDGFEIHPVTMEVRSSTVPPFSERLMLFFITTSNQVAIQAMATALSVSMRKDLDLQYSKFIGEIMKYGNDGRNMMIRRGWLEQPPLSADRKKLSQE